MKFTKMKQWEQLDLEIEFWRDIIKNNGKVKRFAEFPLCVNYDLGDGVFDSTCQGCPLRVYIGANCDTGTPYSEWEADRNPQTAQAMVDRLVEIRNILHRLDR